MIIRTFLLLTALSSSLRNSLWRLWYQQLAARYTKSDWRFMNYGYTSLSGDHSLALENGDEESRLFIQLYAYTLSKVQMQGRRVLEVGAGRGGGAYYVARYRKPASLVGLDYSRNAVDLASRFYQIPNLRFIEGNAEKLPFPNQSFDVVYNVESSHCYGNMAAFITEVYRVLKPGGILAWSDLRTPKTMRTDERIFQDSGFQIRFKENITANVLRALALNSDSKADVIKQHVPAYAQRTFSEFAGIKGGMAYTAFQQGKLVYWHYLLQKPLYPNADFSGCLGIDP